jgi:hypothetical protein
MTDVNCSWILIKSNRLNSLLSYIWNSPYNIKYLTNIEGDIIEECAICFFNGIDNDTLRYDMLKILNSDNSINYGYIKYNGDVDPKMIKRDGVEISQNIITDFSQYKDFYVIDNQYFYFEDKAEYWLPESIDDIRVGMIIEYFDKNTWNKRKIVNPSEEWDGFIKVFVKYKKVRIIKENIYQ